jgi:hypothetical protein
MMRGLPSPLCCAPPLRCTHPPAYCCRLRPKQKAPHLRQLTCSNFNRNISCLRRDSHRAIMSGTPGSLSQDYQPVCQKTPSCMPSVSTACYQNCEPCRRMFNVIPVRSLILIGLLQS